MRRVSGRTTNLGWQQRHVQLGSRVGLERRRLCTSGFAFKLVFLFAYLVEVMFLGVQGADLRYQCWRLGYLAQVVVERRL